MSAQYTYKFSTPIGAPGGIVDLAPHAIDSFANTENTGVLKPGLGVVYGTVPSKQIKLPVAASTAGTFAGIVVNGRTTEYDLDGNLRIVKGATVGVMRYGRIYGRVAADVSVAYGDPVYLLVEGDEAGCFQKTAGGGADPAAIAIKGRFIGTVDATTQVAPIELFNQAQA